MVTTWVPDLAGFPGPKYLAIADAVASAIGDGTFPPGAKLPPQRNLAYDLKVTLGTVTRAYQELERRGVVGGEVGRGTYVLSPDQPKPDGFIHVKPDTGGKINLTHAMPVPGRAGQVLARTLAELAETPGLDPLCNYQQNTGLPRHLAAGAEWLRGAGLQHATADNVALCNGAQHGLLTSLMATTRPGDTVLAECLSFPGFIQVATHLGLKLEPVVMDGEGVVPEALEEAARRTGARVAYVMPAVNNPTAVCMTGDRVRGLADTLRRLDMTAIEDDVWGNLTPREAPPLATLAPERTLHVTSLSKCMAGGLRIGYVLAPGNRVERVRTAVRGTGWVTAPLMAEIATRWMEDGTGHDLTRWQRDRVQARLDTVAGILAGHRPRFHPAGHFLWLELPPPWRAAEFAQAAEDRGVLVLPADGFTVGRYPTPHAVRVGIGFPEKDADVRRGAEILAELLEEAPQPAAAVM